MSAGLEFAGELIELPDIEGTEATGGATQLETRTRSAWADEVQWCSLADAAQSAASGTGCIIAISDPTLARCVVPILLHIGRGPEVLKHVPNSYELVLPDSLYLVVTSFHLISNMQHSWLRVCKPGTHAVAHKQLQAHISNHVTFYVTA